MPFSPSTRGSSPTAPGPKSILVGKLKVLSPSKMPRRSIWRHSPTRVVSALRVILFAVAGAVPLHLLEAECRPRDQHDQPPAGDAHHRRVAGLRRTVRNRHGPDHVYGHVWTPDGKTAGRGLFSRAHGQR